MRKELRMNLKKITALTLSAAMILSTNMTAFAEENKLTGAEKNTNSIKASASENITREDEEARERECMSGSLEYLKKFLTYLSLKYPEIGIDPQYGTGGNPDIADKSDELYNWYNATKMARQKEYETIVIDGNDTFEGFSNLTKNMVQFRYLGNFGGSIGSDDSGQTVYSDTVKTLIIRNVDEIRNLYVPASIENLIIENTTLNCYYWENDSPGFQCGMNPGDLMHCENLKKLVLKNVKFGNNYKHPELEVGTWGTCGYEKNFVLNLQNCHELEELEIDVSFEGAEEVQLAINGGTENLFEKLTDEKCKINPAPGTGYGQVSLYANENSYLAKRYNSSEAVKFKNGQFRWWLLEAIGVDSNNDGIISQAELDAIETLIINDQTAHSARQTSLSAFQELADIAQMHGLKTLELDFYDPGSSYASNGNRQLLKGIDFPDSLENLTMKNIYWEKDTQTKSHDNADIILENLKTLELYNTEVKTGTGDSYFNHSTQIVLTDTEGVLQSCIIEKTDVESVALINNSDGKGIKSQDEKQRIRFSASECPKLKGVEFLGEGYAVEGSLDLTNDAELTHIGIPNNDNSQWTVYGEFDMTYAPINVILSSCSKLGLDCEEIVIDYDFVNNRSLYVQTMDTNFSDSSKLTIKRQPRIENDAAGDVYLSCDEGTWVYNNYNETEGFVIENRSSFPTIAVFANGQRIRASGEGNHNNDSKYTEDTDRWVERWNLVMQPGGYSANFGNLTFYVVDKVPDPNNSEVSVDSLRRVFYKDDIYVEWEQQEYADPIITLSTVKDDVTGGYKLQGGSKLSSTGTPGEVELKLYVYEKNSDGTFKTNENGNKVKSYIGYQNIKIFAMPDSVELVNDGTERGSGTKDDPFIIEKDEELKLKARLLVDNNVDRSGDYALRDVYWRIKEYDETPKYTSDSDGYSLYTLDSATKAGISVVRGELNPGETEAQYDKRVDNIGVADQAPTYYNHRRFTFDTVGSKFKIVAQAPFKQGDKVNTTEAYVEIREPVEDPAEKPNDDPAEKPNDDPAEKPNDDPAEKPNEDPAEKPNDDPAGKPNDDPAEKPNEDPAEKPNEDPAEKPNDDPVEKPTEKPAETPVEKPTEKPAETPTEKPAETPTQKPNEAPKPAKVIVSQTDNISIEVTAKGSNGEALAIEKLAEKITVTDKKVIFAKAKEMPVVEGYTFKGWYQDGSNKKISSIPAKKYSSFADAKINAVYVENVYNIDYKVIKPQGVKGVKVNGKPAKQTKIKYTEKVKISSVEIQAKAKEDKKAGTPEKHYKVVGWTTEKNGATVMYKPGAEISKLAGKTKKDKKVILYPVWEEVK